MLSTTRHASKASVLKNENESANTPDGEVPNEYERNNLRRVSDKIPLAAWLVVSRPSRSILIIGCHLKVTSINQSAKKK